MIIWDKEKKEQIIRIKGQIKTFLSDNDFLDSKLLEACKADIKQKVDNSIIDSGYHSYVHIYNQTDKKNKISANYVTWLGPLDEEPKENWWLGEGEE